MKMIKKCLYIAGFLCCLIFLVFCMFKNRLISTQQIDFSKKFLIAHAAGAIDDKTYTNSLEALDKAINNHFKFIELDLVETTDGHILAAHDWPSFHAITGHRHQQEPISLSEAKQRKIFGKYTPIFDEDILSVFENNPELILVTDKMNNFDLLERYFSPLKNRMIVEVFSIDKYNEAYKRGFPYPAFCVKKNIDRLNEALKNNVSIITFDMRAEHSFFEKIKQSGLISLGYTSNQLKFVQENTFINGIYTDRLVPQR